jgi:hypothetical protein
MYCHYLFNNLHNNKTWIEVNIGNDDKGSEDVGTTTFLHLQTGSNLK